MQMLLLLYIERNVKITISPDSQPKKYGMEEKYGGSTSQILARKAVTQLPLAHSSCSRFLNLMGCHFESQTTSIRDNLHKASNMKPDFINLG